MARLSVSVPIRLTAMIAIGAAAQVISATASARTPSDHWRGVETGAPARPSALSIGLDRGASVFQIERCLLEELRHDRAMNGTARRVGLPPAYAPEEGFRCPIETDA